MAPKTIVLKGDPIRKEAQAGGAIKPGHLIAFDSSGDLVVHATAGGDALPRFAVEEEFVGDDIDDAYADDDQVQYVVGRPGDELYAWATTSQTIKKGDALSSAGDGTLQKHTALEIDQAGSGTKTVYADAIVAYAAEDKTTTSAALRIKVEVA